MLILTRRVGETLMIGDDITVTVLGVKGNQVRIGVNAPKEIAVHREEIYERIKREREARSGATHPLGIHQRQTHRSSSTGDAVPTWSGWGRFNASRAMRTLY